MPIEWFDGWAVVQSGTPQTITAPMGTGWQPGDLRLLPLSTSASRSFTVPDGWTPLYASAANSGANAPISRSLALIARVLAEGDTDPSIPVVGPAGPNVANAGITVRGADNAAVLASVPTVAGASAASRSVEAPSVPTGAGLLLTLHLITRTDGTANTGAWADPPGMARVGASLSDGTMGYNVLLAAEPRTSGASGTRTATAETAGAWTGLSLFLPELVVPAPTGPEPGRMHMAYA